MRLLRGAAAGVVIGLLGAAYVIVREWWRTANRLSANAKPTP